MVSGSAWRLHAVRYALWPVCCALGQLESGYPLLRAHAAHRKPHTLLTRSTARGVFGHDVSGSRIAWAAMTASRETSAPEDFGPNVWLVDQMYLKYLEAPDSVSESWREFFEDYQPVGAGIVEGSTEWAGDDRVFDRPATTRSDDTHGGASAARRHHGAAS